MIRTEPHPPQKENCICDTQSNGALIAAQPIPMHYTRMIRIYILFLHFGGMQLFLKYFFKKKIELLID